MRAERNERRSRSRVAAAPWRRRPEGAARPDMSAGLSAQVRRRGFPPRRCRTRPASPPAGPVVRAPPGASAALTSALPRRGPSGAGGGPARPRGSPSASRRARAAEPPQGGRERLSMNPRGLGPLSALPPAAGSSRVSGPWEEREVVSALFFPCGSCERELGLREGKVCVAVCLQSPNYSPLVPPGLSGFCFPCLIWSPGTMVVDPIYWQTVDCNEASLRNKGAVPARGSFLLEQFGAFTRNRNDE